MTISDVPAANVCLALLHYPVYDKNRQVVTTAVTNLDLHDIARAARTFGLHRYYVVTPVAEQQKLAERVIRHWQEGWGATYNPKRKAALDQVRVIAGLDDVLVDMTEAYGRTPRVVVTGAGERGNTISFGALSELCRDRGQPYLLLFGTGWGMTKEIFERADYVLPPIKGPSEYNHLSVRSAVSIILDRLFGERE
ncbi:RNA methyltransferase [Geobacter sp. AOG1]|uniref:RNA methyltransferase n=1 Tax=Geobacter sp. AOG1 TaxID=1566346 RepID=UPI001CC580E8|nr:RNA methyltransferase [Geobacter sp. AOG1]GFE57793.1 hypothetical protein AOG1_16730 [Geobacter sp. AOG1]